MRILRSADYKRMPWKNGKGETVEIAVFPPNASVGDFDWRVSMATVTEDGPFSVFDGVDRTLSILSGEGIELFVAGQEPKILLQETAPFAFPADAATSARVLRDTVTDLNVMTRRGQFGHEVSRLSLEKQMQVTARHAVTLVFAVDRCRCGSQELFARDAVLLEPGENCIFEASGSRLALLLIGIEPSRIATSEA